MPTISANSIKMHYKTSGTGDDLVLLHGVTSSLAMWYNGILPALQPAFRTTIYDLRGHGLTEVTPHGYNSYDMSTDLKCLLDGLGIEKTLLVGHSYGGAIATHFALRFPERVKGLVVLDSGFACLRYLRIIREWSGWNREKRLLPGMTLDTFLDVDDKQDITDFLKKTLDVPRVGGFRKGQTGLTPRQKRLIDETAIGSEFREVAGMTEELLATIELPTLALYGETSPYQKMAARLTELLPQCRNEIIPGAGHFYSVFTPGLVPDRIIPFLRDPAGYVQAGKLVNPIHVPTVGTSTLAADSQG